MNEALPYAFGLQARFCRGLHSPLYAELLERCAAELERGDVRAPLVRLMQDWEGDLERDIVPLRVMGGVHALVLTGRAPALAAHYASAGGTPRFPECWRAFRATVDEHCDELRGWLDRVPQTNEVQRSACLLGGFLEIARQHRYPLRLYELGASAGLNQFWDRYRYELGEHRWGAEDARLVLRCDWQGGAPALDAPARVEARLGCDRNPLDLGCEEDRLALQAFFWPDDVERMQRVRTAIECALEHPPRLDREGAGTWIAKRLAEPAPEGVCRVVYHSTFWTYLDDDEQRGIRDSIERAGARAGERSPVAWLRAEHEHPAQALRLTTWPSGEERHLADLHPHGRWVHWHA